MKFTIKEQIIYYQPEWRKPWTEKGSWPHENLYGFHEAVVGNDFRLRGYGVIHDYSVTNIVPPRMVTLHFTRLVHDFVGKSVSDFFINDIKRIIGGDAGQPDLFVFHEDHPNDPKIKYPDDPDNLRWYFVECKGPDEAIRDTQLKFWRAIAERDDLDLGSKRLKLFRALPVSEGCQYEPNEYEF